MTLTPEEIKSLSCIEQLEQSTSDLEWVESRTPNAGKEIKLDKLLASRREPSVYGQYKRVIERLRHPND